MAAMTLVDLFTYYAEIFAPVPTKPFRLGSWVWSTNGHVLVGLADDGRDCEETPEKKRTATRYLDTAPDDLVPTSLAVLRAFAGDVVPAHVDCDECDGSGYSDIDDSIKCEHCGHHTRLPCEMCGGDGTQDIEKRYGFACGLPINRTLLAAGLAAVPSVHDAIQIGTVESATADARALVVVGEGWRVVLMRLKEAEPSAPTFNPQIESLEAGK